MIHYSNHFKTLCEKCAFPKEACDVLGALAKRMDTESIFAEKFNSFIDQYMYDENATIMTFYDPLKVLGDEMGVNHDTICMLFVISCAEILHKNYLDKGFDEEFFWETMQDLRYKLVECMDYKHIVGTFVLGWFDGFYKMRRFTFDRFQFEESTFPIDYTTKDGHILKKGEKCLDVHIPSSGVPLTDKIRHESYKKAYDFFKNVKGWDKVFFMCNSWLLFSPQKVFLPQNSNILKFMGDYEIVSIKENEEFEDGWRIFGDACALPTEKLPEDNSLRKAYKEWLMKGNLTGTGFGVIVFNDN